MRFDESSRLRELVSQMRARREQSITGNGHGLAMAAASAGMSPLAQLNHQLSGMAGIRNLRALDERLNDSAQLEDVAAELAALHDDSSQCPCNCCLWPRPTSSPRSQKPPAASGARRRLQSAAIALTWPPIRERRGELWLTNTQVNFCARAYPTVPVEHPDAAPLTVLGGVMRNGFLHRAIREQGGAYGGGASQDSGIAAFRFYSYRDPRLAETLQDFDASISWMLESTHDTARWKKRFWV